MEDISAAVIHDVKNLLGELALRLESRGDAPQELEIALGAAHSLTELLLVKRQQAGMLQANIDSASPADLLLELRDEYHALFPALDIRVSDDAIPPFWYYDEALIRLALGNAMHNACRHASSVVMLAARKEGEALLFEVRDDGPGFPEERLHATGDAPAPASRGGTGLGLYLSRKIAELHTLNGKCGSVSLKNDGGGVFCMTLP